MTTTDRRNVRVVLGEVAPTGTLRYVLEDEGFEVAEVASSDEELERVLARTRPSVIVLDGGISAIAAVRARERARGAALVVVWPDGVAPVVANERVDPRLVIEDLGEAVRRASRETGRFDARIVTGSNDPPRRSTRTPFRVLVAAATWILLLLTLATIAAAVPHVLFSDGTRGHPSGVAASTRPSERTSVVDVHPAPAIERGKPACEPADRGRSSTHRSDRAAKASCRPDGRHSTGHGAAKGTGKGSTNGSDVSGGRKDSGRPDDLGDREHGKVHQGGKKDRVEPEPAGEAEEDPNPRGEHGNSPKAA